MPSWSALSFQDSISPSMEHILFFHDHAMIILSLITILTLYLVMSLMLSKKFNKFIMEGQEIETIWTVLPAFMLIFIALPSLKTLYLMEDTKNPVVTIKTTGHQWYWSYEYTSLNSNETDNFMEASKYLRLLKTSEMLHLPVNVLTRSLITSADVIHSWTIPSMGTKVDALPGRLNQIFLMSKRLGLYSGQCSEICGMNHSFMPILAQFYSPKEFIKKMKEM
uniref:Cytochrome c oxidase subunit 2 n=1 Tax=Oribatula sp. XFX TaxID=2652662 RepID=A0A5J6VDA2_9ACAR|nr:cytochrome oxidase subunit 2 [Oribatula sp. XFX]